DHVIYTKRLPMVGRDVQSYVEAYRQYFATHQSRSAQALTMLDPAPRVVLDPELGLLTLGRTAKQARIAEESYRHTIETVLRATALGGYKALPAGDIFDVEYWELEQAKLRSQGTLPVFQGEIALVTGAASGIGKTCVASLLSRGAAVVALDINAEIETTFQRRAYLWLRCDVSSDEVATQALFAAVIKSGGLDMLILIAGFFTPRAAISALRVAAWDRVMLVNLKAD